MTNMSIMAQKNVSGTLRLDSDGSWYLRTSFHYFLFLKEKNMKCIMLTIKSCVSKLCIVKIELVLNDQ